MKLYVNNVLGALVLANTAMKASCQDEEFTFGVFDDAACSVETVPGQSASAIRKVAGGCTLISYVDPDGVAKTNAEDLFNCCENFVEWMQYAGTDVCGDPTQGKWIYNVMSSECDPVETSFGQTYQQLSPGYIRCSQRYNYNGLYGSDITEEQCNDPNFVPTGGSWVLAAEDIVAPPDSDSPKDNGDSDSDSGAGDATVAPSRAFAIHSVPVAFTAMVLSASMMLVNLY